MESIITSDDRVAMAEVDYVIHHMNEKYINKIPQNVLDFIAILKKNNMQVCIDPKQPLEKQGLKEFTLYFLMILNLKYWCDDERRKEILVMLENNQKKFENKVNDIFEQVENMQGDLSNTNNEKNKSKEVIVKGTPKQSSVIKIDLPKEQEDSEEFQERVDVVEQLKEETENVTAIIENSKENFLKKIINKFKAIFVKSKQ